MATSSDPPNTSRTGQARADAVAGLLWSLGWAMLVGAGVGLALALFAEVSTVWITALAMGVLPGLIGAAWRPTGLARLALMSVWGLAAVVAAVLTGGLTGPLSPWSLSPLLAAVALGGGLLDGLAFSALSVILLAALAAFGGSVVPLPPSPTGVLGLAFSAIGAVTTLVGAGAATLIARRREVRDARARDTEISELQVLLGDIPYLAVALEPDDSVYAVFGQNLPAIGHHDLYGGLAASAAEADRTAVRMAFAEAIDHGDAEVHFAPATDDQRRLSAALHRTRAGGVVAVLRDVTEELAQRRPAEAPRFVPEPAPVSPAEPVLDRSGLLSLTARLEEMRVRAKEAELARGRAEEAMARMQDELEHARQAAAAAPAPVHHAHHEDAQAVVAALTSRIAELDAARSAAEARSAKAEQTLQARSRFLANMSHELRTPLNAIMGFSDIMRARMFGELTPKYGEYAELIHESGRHLMDLISDVLDMSKIEAERFKLSHEVFDAREAVNAALRLMRVQAEEVGVNLRGLMPAAPVMVNADRRAMKQIVLNLVSNALKFTPRGGHVSVTTHAIGAALEIAVSDTGVGIAPDDLQRLGRPFEQAGDSADQSRGTGLGLSLVKAFAQLHGGDMSIESQLGSGTSVLVRMPVLSPLPDEAPAPLQADAAATATAPPPHAPAQAAESAPTAQVIPLVPRQG